MEKELQGWNLDRFHSAGTLEAFSGAVKAAAALHAEGKHGLGFDPRRPGSLTRAMIVPGRKIDARFPLKIVEHGVLREVEFAALLTRPTIVSVFMKLKTPSCDRQVEALRTQSAGLASAGCNVIALSRDTARAQQRYALAHASSVVFASDPEDRFARATDSLVEKTMYGRVFIGPARADIAGPWPWSKRPERPWGGYGAPPAGWFERQQALQQQEAEAAAQTPPAEQKPGKPEPPRRTGPFRSCGSGMGAGLAGIGLAWGVMWAGRRYAARLHEK